MLIFEKFSACLWPLFHLSRSHGDIQPKVFRSLQSTGTEPHDLQVSRSVAFIRADTEADGKWEFTEKQHIRVGAPRCGMPAWIPDVLAFEPQATANGSPAKPGQTKSSSWMLKLEIRYYSVGYHNSSSCSHLLRIVLTGLGLTPSLPFQRVQDLTLFFELSPFSSNAVGYSTAQCGVRNNETVMLCFLELLKKQGSIFNKKPVLTVSALTPSGRCIYFTYICLGTGM